MSGIMSMVLGARTAIAAAVDEFFNRVTLLLPGDGTNGAQNNTFLDSSSNNFSITRNPTSGPNAPTQGTFSPFSQTGWSSYMNSSGATLVNIYLNGETDFAFGTGDFTIEMFVYLISSGANQVIYDSRPASTNGLYPTIYLDNTAAKLKFYTNSGDRITQTSTFTYNTWHHVVVTRTGTSTKMFVDGVQEGSTYTDSNSYLNGAVRPATTNGNSNSDGAVGYLSNLRVVKGSGPYQSAGSTITVPTASLTPVANTVLLTLQSNRFVDTNTQVAAKTVNVSNGPSIQAFSPFAPTAAYSASTNGGSGYFDGTGDYLSVSQTAGNFGTSNWSIECYYFNSAAYSGTVYPRIVSKSIVTSAPSGAWGLGTRNGTTDEVYFSYYTGSAFTSVGTGINVNDFAWHHLLATYDGSRIRVFVDGVLRGNAVPTISSFGASTTDSVLIGYQSRDAHHITGYVSGLRIVNGGIPTSYQTASTTNGTSIFTPPSAPVTTSSQGASGTSLLLNFTNAGITDATAKNVLETVGNAQISTTQSKWGGSSIACTTGTSYLLVRPTQNLEFGSGDFTIEFWWYPVSTTRQALYHGSFGTDWSIGIDFSSTGTQKIGLWASTTGSTWNLINSDSGGNGIGTTTITQNAWNHIAFVRSGTTWSLYVNGNRDLNLTSISGSIVNRSTASKGIGVWYQSTGAPAPQTGYIDDFRVSKFARYSGATITTPAAAFPLS